MEIYNSKYLIINYLVDKELVEYIWKSATAQMTDDIYLYETNKILTLGLRTDAKYVIADKREFQYPLSPDIHAEVTKKILVQVKGLIIRFARVVNSDFFSQLPLKQLYDEENEYHVKFFDNYDEALKWVLYCKRLKYLNLSDRFERSDR